MNANPNNSPERSRLLLWGALGYTAFAIYGSLVPLRYRPLPLDAAWRAFQDIRYLELGIGSRADWVANILLFVPLAFLWLGVLWPQRGHLARAAAGGLVVLACAALSVAIEFTQLFFPPRTVSLNDIAAEVLGALLGVVLWVWTGERFRTWLDGWLAARTPRSAAQRFLYVYLFLLFGYNVLPLDLTISVVEIYHKWREGKVLLLPFSAVYASRPEQAYALAAGVAIWVPAAWLWRMASHRSAGRAILNVVAWAAAIEFFQLFVYSRVTSSTDILTAACGGALGAILAGGFAPQIGARPAPRSGPSGQWVLVWVLALAVWLGVLMTVFWYPFDFVTDWGFVHGRLAALKRAPFEAYYYGTEFRAVTEVMHKTGFFFPLGALLAIAAAWLRRRLFIPLAVLHAASALVVAGAAAGIELGQLFLRDKNADPTDFLLETLGALAGYVCLRMLAPERQRRWT